MVKALLSYIIVFAVGFCQVAWSDPIVAGPLELTPINAEIVIKSNRHRVTFHPTIKFSLKNRSSSDIQIILIASKTDAFDNLNQKLFFESQNAISASGISISYQKELKNVFVDDKSNFVTLSPSQQTQIYIYSNPRIRPAEIEDRTGDFLKTHRPTTLTFNAAVGVINLDGSSEIRTFSFSDVPASVSVR